MGCNELSAQSQLSKCVEFILQYWALASVKSRLVLPLWYRLIRVVLDKGPLNVCVCVCWAQKYYNTCNTAMLTTLLIAYNVVKMETVRAPLTLFGGVWCK